MTMNSGQSGLAVVPRIAAGVLVLMTLRVLEYCDVLDRTPASDLIILLCFTWVVLAAEGLARVRRAGADERHSAATFGTLRSIARTWHVVLLAGATVFAISAAATELRILWISAWCAFGAWCASWIVPCLTAPLRRKEEGQEFDRCRRS